MNLSTLKSNKNYLIALVATLILTALIGFYSGRFYERKAFETRFTQMRGSFQGRQNGGSTNTGPGMMRTFDQTRPY